MDTVIIRMFNVCLRFNSMICKLDDFVKITILIDETFLMMMDVMYSIRKRVCDINIIELIDKSLIYFDKHNNILKHIDYNKDKIFTMSININNIIHLFKEVTQKLGYKVSFKSLKLDFRKICR